jgi:DNA-binding LacI/PurR family transcriptional regulator
MADGSHLDPTILDVARLAGVSAMTVSRALRGHAAVHPRTRELVQRCAQQLGYRPHRWARSLVTRSSRIIGVVVPDISHTYFAEITAGVEEVVEGAGYDLLLCHSRMDPLRERKEINMLLESRVDGLVVASEQDEAMFLDLHQRRFPFVLVDRYFPPHKLPSVRVSDIEVGRIATNYLISLGHQQIGHILGPNLSVGMLRHRGYVEALRAHGLPVRKERIVAGNFGPEGGRNAMQQLLRLTNPPTAVFAANDPMAVGAIFACREAGVRVPEDISIVGAGSIEGSNLPSPFLTTIDWPRQELGRSAARMLLSAIANPEQAAGETVFDPQLLVRASTAEPGTMRKKSRAGSRR